MTILLVRHGETVDNASHTFQMPDSRLSENGNTQAAQLAEHLAQFNISEILCSDYFRTKQTASHITEKSGIQPNYTELLRERNFGDIRGRPYAQLDFDPFALDYQPVNGESWLTFDNRISLAWEHIISLAARAKGDILIVTHGFVCHSITANHASLLAGLEAPSRWGNTSVTEIEMNSPWLITRLNCTEHLGRSTESSGQV
ncbi:MAG: putative phosphoglycerate mutase [Arenicella sp.]|jgi:probable phosphoglycerate mutase